MTSPRLSRRTLLAAGAALTLHPAISRAAAGDRKLVVIIARGGMDGLSLAPPIGDRDYAALRGEIAIRPDQALVLDGDFGLHPRLAAVHALARRGQARIAPAAAIPNNQRSHFEAQDILESGSPRLYGETSGWLNRALGALAGRHVEGLSIGTQAPLILKGPVQAASWSPGRANRGERLPMVLADLYADDPLLSRAFASGLETEAMAQSAGARMIPAANRAAAQAGGPAVNAQAAQLGQTAARFMLQPGGPQVVSLSIDGWDTHANQGAAEGQLANRLAYLDATIDGLVTALGEEWKNTSVLVVTEFGRTARVNGTRGTDHGTASAALLLGGGLKPGGIVGDWPTLAANRLHEGRDLASTLDVRALFKGVLAEHMGVDARALDEQVFPASAGVRPVTGLV